MNILAIDQGTSATKALVVAPDGSVLAAAEHAVHPCLVDGGVEQDPEELWQSVVAAGRAALLDANVPVGAVGLANQGETVLAWDSTSGQPLGPALSWQDRRAQDVCERLAGDAAMLTARTGLPLDPYFAAPKMAWLRAHRTRAGVVATTDAWLVQRLTGAFVTDAATASRTLLMDLDRGVWSSEACRCFGIDPGELPAIVGCATTIGETTAFGPRLPLAGLAVDQQAALFAERCLAAGDAKCTYGTGAFLLATMGRVPRRSTVGLVASVAWRIGDATTYCFDGQVYTAGAAVQWLERVGMLRDAAAVDATAGAVRAGASDVVFVPALAGLGAPFSRPAARGVFVGLTLATEQADLVRAVLEGVAAQVATLATAIEADLGVPLTRLRVDGGLTRSRVLMQLQADLLQRPVEVYPSPHATAIGIAALARIGVGAARSADQAIAPWTPSMVYEPRLTAAAAAERLARWRRVATEATAL